MLLVVLSAFLLMEVACTSTAERGDTDKKSPAATDADNTARNSRDRDGVNKTAGIKRKTKVIAGSRQVSARRWLEMIRCR
jgi:hypothetical protein